MLPIVPLSSNTKRVRICISVNLYIIFTLIPLIISMCFSIANSFTRSSISQPRPRRKHFSGRCKIKPFYPYFLPRMGTINVPATFVPTWKLHSASNPSLTETQSKGDQERGREIHGYPIYQCLRRGAAQVERRRFR